MFSKIAYASLATVGLSLVGAAPAQANPPAHRHHVQVGGRAVHHRRVPVRAVRVRSNHYHAFYVEYRQLRWKERVFANPAQGQQFAAVKRGKGFEIRESSTSGGLAVHYRLPFWRTYRTVNNRVAANDLAALLHSRGYETRIIR
jgi:hypothetical protein